jgi:hypothetical protein
MAYVPASIRHMNIWTEFVNWFQSAAARPIIFNGAVLIVGVIVAALISALIARGAIKGLVSQSERQQKASAIAALIDAATEASVWHSLSPAEQVISDRTVGQADILVRLLPIKGAGIAATWANHQLGEMKRSSATYGYQLDPAIAEFRDRLIEWQNNPSRARKVFLNDLERWRFDSTDTERAMAAQQDAWVAQQHHEQYANVGGTADTETYAQASEAPSSARIANDTNPLSTLPHAPESLSDDGAPTQAYTPTLS